MDKLASQLKTELLKRAAVAGVSPEELEEYASGRLAKTADGSDIAAALLKGHVIGTLGLGLLAGAGVHAMKGELTEDRKRRADKEKELTYLRELIREQEAA